MNKRSLSWHGLLLSLPLLMSFAGCSTVRVHGTSLQDHLAAQRDDVLRSGKLSAASREALLVLGFDANACATDARPCRERVEASRELEDERRLATLAELQLADALAVDRTTKSEALPLSLLDRYAEVARTSYAYLFFTARDPGERAFEDRQTQVRGFYNYATERLASIVFERRGDATQMRFETWQARLGSLRLRQAGEYRPQELVPTSRLRFVGLRSTYGRDGLGATFVAIAPARQSMFEANGSLVESRFLPATVILRFPGATLGEVLASRSVIVDVYDPHGYDSIPVGGRVVPLAANFTAPYALWLSQSKFEREAGRALHGRASNLRGPRIFLIQPYDPDRRTVVMLHGFGSSPGAWVNLVNEVMGDRALGRDCQIWQVFYPTNLPIAENVRTIRQALLDALETLDPAGTARASRGITLIGHSMGGVISRLLVVESGDALWQSFFYKPIAADERARYSKLEPYLTLRPLPQVEHAILIAAPHRGSPVASSWLGRTASHLVRLPATAVQTIATMADEIADELPDRALALRTRRMNSVTNLSDRDRYLRATATLPIASSVTYHSIIGRVDPAVPLEQSTDGTVPYLSAHLDGASSELVVTSGHGVQETPQAILEIRRILRSEGESPQ
jgi:pimeloyl-ACP methyl ester carboxylesterase